MQENLKLGAAFMRHSLSFNLGWGKKHLTEKMIFEEKLERDKSTGHEDMV